MFGWPAINRWREGRFCFACKHIHALTPITYHPIRFVQTSTCRRQWASPAGWRRNGSHGGYAAKAVPAAGATKRPLGVLQGIQWLSLISYSSSLITDKINVSFVLVIMNGTCQGCCCKLCEATKRYKQRTSARSRRQQHRTGSYTAASATRSISSSHQQAHRCTA